MASENQAPPCQSTIERFDKHSAEDALKASDRLAQALEALAERAFGRCLFPAEVKEAFVALDAWRTGKNRR